MQQDRHKHLLVTGAMGYLGNQLMQSAHRFFPGIRVSGVDLNAGPFTLDVRDRDACMRVVQHLQPTHLIHAAAITAGSSDEEMAAVNISGAQNILDGTLSTGMLQRGVLLSSSGVYGSPAGEMPCDEDHPLDLRGAYAATKYKAERLWAERVATQKVSLVAARIGPCYGAGEQAGQFRPRLSLVGRLEAALSQHQSIRIAGTDYERDWTHVDDICAALYSLLFAPALRHLCYNVSSGVPVGARAILELFQDRGLRVEWVQDVASADIVLRAEDGRVPMVIDRLREDTGFVPKISMQQVMERLAPRAQDIHAQTVLNGESKP